LAEGRAPWAIPWPCIHEFFAITTHPRIYNPPTPLEIAVDQIEAWLESLTLVMLSESADYWPLLRSTLQGGRISGPQVHDARVATICQQHEVSELWTADRDFGRFPGVTVRNPLIS
jgi:predicted nucleic acid-binding protein